MPSSVTYRFLRMASILKRSSKIWRLHLRRVTFLRNIITTAIYIYIYIYISVSYEMTLCRMIFRQSSDIYIYIYIYIYISNKSHKYKYTRGKCARNLNLTMPTNAMCTTQHLSLKITQTISYWTLIYKRIT